MLMGKLVVDLVGKKYWPNFKVDLEKENGNILKNGFYQRILQALKKNERVKNIFY